MYSGARGITVAGPGLTFVGPPVPNTIFLKIGIDFSLVDILLFSIFLISDSLTLDYKCV
jgi:hypothetical protein